MQLSVKADFKDVQRKLDGLRKDIATKVMVQTINRTMDQAKTSMVKQITSEYNVKSSYVRDRLRIRRASFSQGLFQASASLIGTGKRSANMIAFLNGKPTKSGALRFKVRKGAGRSSINGAFVGNKGRTVFRRVPGTTMASRSKYAGTKHAQQIEPVQTIDVPQMFNAKRVNQVVLGVIRQRFSAVFDQQMRYYLERMK